MILTVPLRIIDLDNDGFHLLIDINLYGKDFTVVLDTGASKTAFDKNLLEAHEDAIITATDRLSTGVGSNEITSHTAIIPNLHIGSLHVKNHEVAVLDLSTINIAYAQMNHPQVLGVLGGDILVKYKAVVDYGKKQVKFIIKNNMLSI